MCQLNSSPLSSKCNENLPFLISIEDQEPEMFTSLLILPTSPACMQQEEQEPNTTTLSLAIREAIAIAKIAFPMILTGLFLYPRSMISMLFLGQLGELALAGGSLAVGFANITGYSILSGLAMGMEPICGQASGAKKHHLLGRDVAKNNTFAHWIKGVALSGVWTNFNLVCSLIIYILVSGVHKKTWGGFSMECFKEWKTLLNLAIPSCISVCLEWWWYEIMILLCGLLLNPRATVASMGILIQTTALIYIFPSSLSFSVSTRVGNELGANQPKKAKLAAIVGLSFSFVFGFSALVFAVMVRNVWASMFTQDEEIIALTSLVLPIIGLCELGNCPQTTGCGVLRGTARPKVGANINLGCFYLVGTPVAVWLAFFAGTDWESEAQRAKELTNALVLVADVDDSLQVEEKKEDSSHLFEETDDLHKPFPV
ncbi:PROTEIN DETOXIFICATION [Salix purpurea]|uniref:PROTEIN DETOXIFICATION n=1 Tax=Salix purpurea TaxID=77065 RepID=A0A9Q0VFU4_SALPP|nr:PROTEIN DETOXIFICATION [Salix purpurea]